MDKSILITDSEQTIREALHLFLTGEGFTCQIAKDTREAVNKVRNDPFDVILLDLQMPRQYGLEALKQIKEHSPNSIVIILTTYYHIEEAALALRKGASKLLLKPIDFEELLDMIKQQLALQDTK